MATRKRAEKKTGKKTKSTKKKKGQKPRLRDYEVARGNRPIQQRDEDQNRANVDADRQRKSTGQGPVRRRMAP
jgi:hypothetical protein